MSDTSRVLPSWMATTGKTVKENEPLKTRKKRRVARAAFYCMNEKDLVEAAVSFLADGGCTDLAPLHQQVEDKAEVTSEKMKDKPSNSKKKTEPVTEALEESSDSDARERAYVSETDLDITELETIPYTNCPEHQLAKGQRSEAAHGHGGVANAEKTKENSHPPADTAAEDDAFQLVREIFFT